MNFLQISAVMRGCYASLAATGKAVARRDLFWKATAGVIVISHAESSTSVACATIKA